MFVGNGLATRKGGSNRSLPAVPPVLKVFIDYLPQRCYVVTHKEAGHESNSHDKNSG